MSRNQEQPEIFPQRSPQIQPPDPSKPEIDEPPGRDTPEILPEPSPDATPPGNPDREPEIAPPSRPLPNPIRPQIKPRDTSRYRLSGRS